ncbi:MAG: FecR family protein [Bacteroidales bacterium]
MESSSNRIKNSVRVTRYISGNMNKLEAFWFEKVIARNSEMKRLVKEMKNDWNTTGEFLNKQKVNPEKAWSSLYQRLESENLLPKKNNRLLILRPQLYLKYAAIVAFALILSGIGGYKYFHPEQIDLANNSKQNTLITTLPDGTTIYLAQNSQITYPKRFVGKTRQIQLDGEAFFEVAKNPNKPFIIDTKAASVKVLGTSFNLKSTDSKNFELNVVEGKVGVNLNSKPNENIIAIAGDRVIANNNKLNKEQAKEISTTKNKMIRLQFQDERFDNIVSVINKTYGSSIKLYGDQLKECRISVTFENEISSIVNILSVSFNLELNRQPDSTIILKEKHE